MPSPKSPKPQALTLDPAQAKAAFEALLPHMEAIDAASLNTPRTGVDMAAIHAFSVAVDLNEPVIRARFEDLDPKHFDIQNLDDLGPAALATWYAATQLLSANAQGTEAKLPIRLVNEATELKARMMRVAEYYFEEGTPQAIEVADIRAGTGYRDLAQDLARLAVLYRDNDAALKADTKRYDANDVDKATTLAGEIIKELGASRNAEQKLWADRVQRAWALLVSLYGDVTETAHWLQRRDADAPHYASLVTAGRAAPKRGKAEKNDEP